MQTVCVRILPRRTCQLGEQMRTEVEAEGDVSSGVLEREHPQGDEDVNLAEV